MTCDSFATGSPSTQEMSTLTSASDDYGAADKTVDVHLSWLRR